MPGLYMKKGVCRVNQANSRQLFRAGPNRRCVCVAACTCIYMHVSADDALVISYTYAYIVKVILGRK